MANVVHENARALSSRTGYRLLLVADAVAHAGVLAWAAVSGFAGFPAGGVVAFCLYVLAVWVTDLGAIGLSASAMKWRRRISWLAIGSVLWRGSPFFHGGWQVAAVLDAAIVWIAILVEGRRVARAVAEATGELVLSVDPTNPDR